MVDKVKDGFCPRTRTLEVGHTELDLKCDLYADHGGRDRTVLSDSVTVFWDPA